MVPREFLALYLTANGIAIAVLAIAVARPRVALWMGAAIFAWASVVNTQTAISTPEVYLEYAALTPSAAYREFILGWFSRHIAAMVLAIAAGQAIIAMLLVSPGAWPRLGVLGASVFLLAIAPLGVGSGFPFSLILIAALVLAVRTRTRVPGPGRSAASAAVRSSAPLSR